MAPRKNKRNVDDEVEGSAFASKRRRIDQFTKRINQFPSTQEHECSPPPNTITINTDLQLFPPAEVDDVISSLMPQQNFLISYHVTEMVMSVKEFWRRRFVEEEKMRKEIETKLKQKEKEVYRLREKYFFYEEKAFALEEILERRVGGAPDEEVESGFDDPNSVQRRMETACRNCRSRPATMLWLPCRHVCVCLVCERRVKQCPICGVHKTESLIINLSYEHA